MRQCTKCQQEKPRSEFRQYRRMCKGCERDVARDRAKQKALRGESKALWAAIKADPKRHAAHLHRQEMFYYTNLEKCQETSRQWQRDNKEAIGRRADKKTQEKRDYVDLIKSAPCTDCGGRFPSESMDLDHVRGDKIDHVSQMIKRAYSLSALQREIEKCEVVCANCHRVRTKKRIHS